MLKSRPFMKGGPMTILTTPRLLLRPFEEGEHREELPGPDDELGYALSPAFWGRGLIPEASGALIRWGFTELGLETIWCNHYDGNTRSRRVIEKCGFRYQFSRETDVPLMGERRLTHFFALTRPQWAADGGEDRR